MEKFEIKDSFTGNVQFTAEIECGDSFNYPPAYKMRFAVQWAYSEQRRPVQCRSGRCQFGRCDTLAGIDLRNVDLSYADLSYADLTDADLRGAMLTGAKLIGAKLGGANFNSMRGADLRGFHRLTLNQPGRQKMEKREIYNINGETQFIAEIHCATDASDAHKTGLAVRWAVLNGVICERCQFGQCRSSWYLYALC